MGPWFAWIHSGIISLTLSSIFILIRLFILNKYSKIFLANISVICWGIITYFVIYFRNTNLTGTVLFISHIAMLFFVIIMQKAEKEKIVQIITLMYAWIVGISLLFYILIIFCDISIPYSIIKHYNDGYPEFRNYRLLIIPNGNLFFYRFQSIFTEPGHLGMIASFFLYVNQYQFKKLYVFICFLGLLFSLSLAAYLLMILGYFIYQFVNGKNFYTKLLVTVITASVLFCTGFYFYEKYPDSPITLLIINRLQYNEDKGIAGNNRVTKDFDYYYKNNFLGSSDMIWGTGSEIMKEKFSWGNSSYKTFILQYGLFGIISLFIFYFSATFSRRSRILFGLFILYCVSFLQRPYALWEMELFLFIGSSEVFYYKQ
jgi:hypothetical protein